MFDSPSPCFGLVTAYYQQVGSPSPAVIKERSRSETSRAETPRNAGRSFRQSLDLGLLLGIAILACVIASGVTFSGIRRIDFLQPAWLLFVVGGTCGVTLVTTPWAVLRQTLRRVVVFRRTTPAAGRNAILDELLACAKLRRKDGLLSLEPMAAQSGHPLLRDALALLVDQSDRNQLQATIEARIRLHERHGQADAMVLEVAAGFAPAVGLLGTVVGLMDALQHFTTAPAAAFGLGTAFASTLYGLALANLILLPAAFRIRATAAQRLELEEMILQGALGLLDGLHPSLLRERLLFYVKGR